MPTEALQERKRSTESQNSTEEQKKWHASAAQRGSHRATWGTKVRDTKVRDTKARDTKARDTKAQDTTPKKDNINSVREQRVWCSAQLSRHSARQATQK